MRVPAVLTRCTLLSLPVLLIFAWGCVNGGLRMPRASDVSLHRLQGHLEFVARHRQNTRQGTGPDSDEEFKETIIEQNLSLKTSGYVYHPKLLEFSLAGLIGLQSGDFEQVTNADRQSNRDEGEILEFDISGTLLKKKPYPINFYARRARSVVPRPFSSSVETLSTTFGGVLQFVHSTFPTTLSLSQSVVDIDSYVKANNQPGRREDSEMRLESAWIMSERSKLTLTYDHKSIQEEPFGFDYVSDDLTLEHRLDFGNESQHELKSLMRYLSQGGNFGSEQLRLSESLMLRHSDRLRSQYLVEIAERQQDSVSGESDVDEQSVRASASVEHHLYDSLVTEASFDFQEQDFSSGLNIKQQGVALGLDYKKKNRWGVLRVDYLTRATEDERVGAGLVGEVIDQLVVFTDPQPVVVREQAIDTSSIRLLSGDRSEIFHEGIDFRVVDFGIWIEIERIPTGLIPEGEAVLLSYRFEIGGDYILESTLKHFNIRQDLPSGLSLYYRSGKGDQTVTPEDASGVTPEDFTERRVGVEFRRKPLRITAEQVDHDSTVSSFRSLRFGFNYTHRIDLSAAVILAANWSDVQYGLPTLRSTRLLRLEGRYVRVIFTGLRFESTLAYRQEADSVTGKDEGIDLDISVDWEVRQVNMRLTYSFGRFRDAFADQDTQALFLQIRRRF